VSAGADAELSLAEEAFDGDGVGCLAAAKDLDCGHTTLGVVRAEYERSATFSYVFP
jgi:hypothetical protein